jgi:hypothetical protein
MSHVASAIASYYADEGKWPPPTLTGPGPLKNTLGVAVATVSTNPPGKYINQIQLMGGVGQIGCSITNTGDGQVDGTNVWMIPSTTADGAITWSWSGTLPTAYMPKK